MQTTNGSWDTMPNLNVVTNDGVSASSTLPVLNGRSGVQDIGGNWDNSPSGYYGVSTDPQSSGLETHLQPKENKYLYICVGNTTNFEGISEVVNQGMDILEQVNLGIESRVAKDSMVETPCIVETYKNGTSWYRVWSDGWCEQGGILPGNEQNITIQFLKSYKDLPVIHTHVYGYYNQNLLSGTADWQHITPRAVSLNSFTVCSSNYGTCWQACGYIA